MKGKYILIVGAVALIAAGFWLRRPPGRAQTEEKSSGPSAVQDGEGAVEPGQGLRPQDPSRRFTDFTPEQRVEFARKGHGPGG